MTGYEVLAKRLRLTRAPTPIEAEKALQQLTYRTTAYVERARHILCHRFGLLGCPKRTLRELGQHHDRSVERIRQIEGQTLRQLLHVRRLGYLR